MSEPKSYLEQQAEYRERIAGMSAVYNAKVDPEPESKTEESFKTEKALDEAMIMMDELNKRIMEIKGGR